MIILGLDISTHCGWALIQDYNINEKNQVLLSGCLECDSVEKDPNLIEDYYFIKRANFIAKEILHLIQTHSPDYVYIEQTNNGRNRTSQKQLEFIHCIVLLLLEENYINRIRYINTSYWRKILNIRLTKDDKQNNKAVKEQKKRGKITPKHLSIRWANETYNINLKIKDNDIADALAIATCGLITETANSEYIDRVTDDNLLDLLNK